MRSSAAVQLPMDGARPSATRSPIGATSHETNGFAISASFHFRVVRRPLPRLVRRLGQRLVRRSSPRLLPILEARRGHDDAIDPHPHGENAVAKDGARELAFDVYSRTMTRLVSLAPRLRRAGISLAWGIDDSRELERQVPRLHLVDEVPFLTMSGLVARLSRTRVERLAWRILVRSGFVRSLIRHVRYRF